MKRTPLLLSLAVLAHLSVIDLTFFLLSQELAVNVAAVTGYNLIWFIVVVLIMSKLFKTKGS